MDKKYYFISFEENCETSEGSKITKQFANHVIDHHPFEWQAKVREYGGLKYRMVLLYFCEITEDEFLRYIPIT